ncbi:MAG: endonuclease [Microbacteriaceae bacterium]|nr:endonuclease [Microbacteriaceae bacterium]
MEALFAPANVAATAPREGAVLAITGEAALSEASALDMLGTLIDAVADSDRQLAVAAAKRARLIDQTRQFSEATAFSMDDPSTVRRWSHTAVARRVLVSELACALRLPERSIETLIAESGTLLGDLPDTLTALEAGAISYRHAQVMIDHALCLPEASRHAFELAALPAALTLTVAKFDRHAHILRERLHPDTIDSRHAQCADNREVTLTPARDGMAWLSAYLPAVAAHAAYNRLTDIAALGSGPAEPRTLTQLRADTLTELLINGTAETTEEPGDRANHNDANDSDTTSGRAALGHGIRARVLITVPVLTLLGHETEPATLEGYGPIDLGTAYYLTARTPSLMRILTHPETGAVLSVGRDRYRIPPDLRTWLRLRDETCRYPGCHTAARHCDIDHTTAWQHHGETTWNNLAHACPKHHDLKHHTRWNVTQDHHGTMHWTSPTAHKYTTNPTTHIRPGP